MPPESSMLCRVVDGIALLSAASLVALLVASARVHATTAGAAVLLVGGAAVVYVLGRSVRPSHDTLAMLWVLVSGALGVVALWPGVVSGVPLAEPMGYGNANGSLLALGVSAALGAMALHTGAGWRLAAGAVATGLLLATLATQSQAAAVMAGALLVLTVFALPARHTLALAAALVLPAVTVAVLLVTIGLGAGWAPVRQAPGIDALISGLTERRVQLWSDAVDLVRDHPWNGIGPGEFSTTSLIAQHDPDTAFAHSLALETAAEAGIPAAVAMLVLLAALVASAALRAHGPAVVVAAGAPCVFAAQAFIDYTYRYPAVVLGWALLTGLMTGTEVARADETD